MKKEIKPYAFNSPQVKNFAFYMVLVVVVVLCVWVYFQVKNESIKCMADPINYGLNKIKSFNNAPLTCGCDYLTDYDITSTNNSSLELLEGGINITWEKKS